MTDPDLDGLRARIDAVNARLLDALNDRLELVEQAAAHKAAVGRPLYDPAREAAMLTALLARNGGPIRPDALREFFGFVFRLSREHVRAPGAGRGVRREPGDADRVYEIAGHRLGAEPQLIAGPAVVESYAQMDRVAARLKELGVGFLRGGAFGGPAPGGFTGLGEEGLRILRRVADRYDLAVVTEVGDARDVDLVARYADVLQVGARSMYNYPLLRAVGRNRRPVLLKRGFMATLDEFLGSAECVVREGNERLILCERGVRTHGPGRREAVDIAAIPLLRMQTPFPVCLDVSHGTPRKEIVVPMAKAALAAGANAIMVLVHPEPAAARVEPELHMDLTEAGKLVEELFG